MSEWLNLPPRITSVTVEPSLCLCGKGIGFAGTASAIGQHMTTATIAKSNFFISFIFQLLSLLLGEVFFHADFPVKVIFDVHEIVDLPCAILKNHV